MPETSVYAYSDPQLTQIISKTTEAIGEMNRMNGIVQSHAGDLGTANRSDSGQILVQNLGTWTTDFNTVVNNLQSLNEKATAILQHNRSAQTNATEWARRS
jgi:hypothetical protein